jgi:hypothetical protein
MLMRRVFDTCCRPWPEQAVQGSAITWPLPSQVGQGATWVKLPKGVRVARRT